SLGLADEHVVGVAEFVRTRAGGRTTDHGADPAPVGARDHGVHRVAVDEHARHQHRVRPAQVLLLKRRDVQIEDAQIPAPRKERSGREALRFLLQEDCALILLDVQMPELDGFETAALIRERERTRYTPIIFVTAVRREEEQILKGYANGAVDYVVKPFSPETMVAKVRFFLDQHRRQLALKEEASQLARER